jgi:DNA/RNA-binding domain of Phe-tRNA-synthetase-like protein
MVSVDPHPLLDLGLLEARFPEPLAQIPSPPWLVELLALEAPAPLAPDPEVQQAVRRLLRHGGFKASGRSKPASEYLIRASQQGALGSINAAVDACNAVSLHSGLPISLVDLDQVRPPLRVALAPAGSSYVFNLSGQVIDLSGLLCLHDAEGPCAGPVKDSQRTKTHPGTRRTLSLLWGTREVPGRTAQTLEWYSQILRRLGAEVRTGCSVG